MTDHRPDNCTRDRLIREVRRHRAGIRRVTGYGHCGDGSLWVDEAIPLRGVYSTDDRLVCDNPNCERYEEMDCD